MKLCTSCFISHLTKIPPNYKYNVHISNHGRNTLVTNQIAQSGYNKYLDLYAETRYGNAVNLSDSNFLLFTCQMLGVLRSTAPQQIGKTNSCLDSCY